MSEERGPLGTVDPPKEPQANGAAERPEPEVKGDSLIDDLRRRREALGRERHRDRDIPGYGGKLVGRFRPLGWKEVRALANRVDDAEMDLNANLDVIVRSCELLYVRKGEDLVPLHEQAKLDAPVRFDAALADLLGFDASKAREVVREAFRNDLVVNSFANELVAWMATANEAADEEFAGK